MIRSVRVSVSIRYRHNKIGDIADPETFWNTLYGQFRTKRVTENIVTPDDNIQPPAGDDLFIVYREQKEYRARSLDRLRTLPGVTVVAGGNIRLALGTLLLTIKGGNSDKREVALYRVFPVGTTLNDIDPIKRTVTVRKIKLSRAQLYAVAYIERCGVVAMSASKWERESTYKALEKKGVVSVKRGASVIEVFLTAAGVTAFRDVLDHLSLTPEELRFLKQERKPWIGAVDWRLAQLNYIRAVKVNGRTALYELTDHGHRRLNLEAARVE